MATYFPPFFPTNISVSITNHKKDYITKSLTRKHMSRNISQHIATGDSPYIKSINILYKNKFYIKNEKKAILGLMAANRFWTFINVQKPKTAMALCKKREKSCCDCYGLILIL